ncbi:MAG: tetratricopeptide repeat protein [Deltaproteobacteria bacterium]|nr:tetratricopeptide repeat protein [Deltaproteobacteria bacterium]
MKIRLISALIGLLSAAPLGRAEVAAPATAASLETNQPPMIVRHSLTEVTVFQGDEVTLTVVPGGKDVQVRWEKEGHIFCRTPGCTIDTGNLGFGSHRLTVIASNSAGTVYLEYSLRIVTAPVDHRPAVVSPRMINGEDLQGSGPDDWAVRLLGGRATLEVDATTYRKSRAIGSLATRLPWAAHPKITTGAQSQIQCGQSGFMELQALADTELTLAETTEGRDIKVHTGTLRVRRLDDAASATTVDACGLATAKLEAHADVIVTCSKDAPAQMSVLRGSIKVRRISPPGSGEVLPEPGYTVGYGQKMMIAEKGDLAGDLQPIETFKIQPLVTATSRDVLPEALSAWEIDGPYRLLLPRSKDATAAKAAAGQYISKQEYLSALETLAPFWTKLAKDGDGALLMARAYAGLYLYEEALAQMREAIKLMPDSPMPHYEIGRLFASVAKWKIAARAYEGADQRDYPNQKELQFRRGEALANSGDPDAALRAFKRVLWYPPSDDSSVKSMNQIEEINDQNIKAAYARVGLFYDSAILRVADTKLELGDGVTRSNYGSGYKVDAGLSLWPYRSAEGWTEIALEATWRDFIKPTSRELATASQRLRFTTEMGLGGTRLERFFTAGITAALGQDIIGAVHQLSRVTAGVQLGSPWLQSMRIEMDRSFLVDPSPGRPRSIEPIRWELGQPGDFAAVQSSIALSGNLWARGDWRFAMKLLNRVTAYRADTMRAEGFSDNGAVLSLVRAPHTRTTLQWQLSQNSRRFAKSLDGRSDNDLIIGMRWDFYFTPDVKQSLEASYETQSSTRSDNKFKRKFVCYELQVDL